jgi:peptidoglycan-N-acetylglucosamine deacetylase
MSRHPGSTERTFDARVRAALRHRMDVGLERLAGAERKLPGGRSGVALTFDDGPHPTHTPPLLDRLEKAGVLATFFWIGHRAQSHRVLAKRVQAAGHCIGSHSFSHAPPRGLKRSSIRDDYLRGRDAVQEVTGESAALFRPPYGSITYRSMAALRALELQPWLWSVDPCDWKDGVSTEELLDRLSGVEAGDVVLLHDGAADEGDGVGSDRSATIELVEPLVETLRDRGLSFVTLDGRSAGTL